MHGPSICTDRFGADESPLLLSKASSLPRSCFDGSDSVELITVGMGVQDSKRFSQRVENLARAAKTRDSATSPTTTRREHNARASARGRAETAEEGDSRSGRPPACNGERSDECQRDNSRMEVSMKEVLQELRVLREDMLTQNEAIRCVQDELKGLMRGSSRRNPRAKKQPIGPEYSALSVAAGGIHADPLSNHSLRYDQAGSACVYLRDPEEADRAGVGEDGDGDIDLEMTLSMEYRGKVSEI